MLVFRIGEKSMLDVDGLLLNWYPFFFRVAGAVTIKRMQEIKDTIYPEPIKNSVKGTISFEEITL